MTSSYQLIKQALLESKESDKLGFDWITFKKGEIIYCEGSTPQGIYFVNQGKVKISKMASDCKEQIIRIATSTDILSYVDLITNSKYHTTARTLEATRLLFITREEFWNIMHSEANILEQFMLLLSQDLQQAEERMTDLAYKPVRGRLAVALMSLAKKYNSVGAYGMFSISVSRRDLAGLVGTAKETVCRFLAEFRDDNLISMNGREIKILDMEGLMKVNNLYN